MTHHTAKTVATPSPRRPEPPSRPPRYPKAPGAGQAYGCVRNYIATLLSTELGVATFADVAPGVSPELRLRHLLEEPTAADELGLDVFAVGQHHPPDYA